MPAIAAFFCILMLIVLNKLPMEKDRLSWAPFLITIAIFLVSFVGIAYSFYPYVVPEQLLITQDTTSTPSLLIIFIGAVAIVPFILGYTIFTYWVFRGKVKELSYH